MKKLLGAVAAVLVMLVSCYEVNEEIVLNDNGSGTYVTKMDMGALLEMMQTMGGQEELGKQGLDRPIDTLIRLKEIMEGAGDLSAEQKKLYREGSVKLQMNAKENLFKTDVFFPFESHEQLAQLMAGSASGPMAGVLQKAFSGQESGEDEQSDGEVASDEAAPAVGHDTPLDQLNSVFDVTVTKGAIRRKLNKTRYDAMMDQPEIAQAKQMAGMVEIQYTTTIKLPRPVKKADNALVKLSPDKKTVTIQYNLMDIFDQPEKFAYSIEY